VPSVVADEEATLAAEITPPMRQFMMRFSNSKLFRNAHRLLLQASGRRLGGKINGMETLLLPPRGERRASSEQFRCSTWKTGMRW